MNTTIFPLLLWIASGFPHSGTSDMTSSAFTLTIQRQVASEKCIMGYLFINETPICYSLELPYIENIGEISSIPTGKYPAFIRTDGSKGWRIELKNVPERANIQIHIGNYTSDITGCTLLGMQAQPEMCSVQSSKDAMKKLEQEVIRLQNDLCLGCTSTSLHQIMVVYQ